MKLGKLNLKQYFTSMNNVLPIHLLFFSSHLHDILPIIVKFILIYYFHFIIVKLLNLMFLGVYLFI